MQYDLIIISGGLFTSLLLSLPREVLQIWRFTRKLVDGLSQIIQPTVVTVWLMLWVVCLCFSVYLRRFIAIRLNGSSCFLVSVTTDNTQNSYFVWIGKEETKERIFISRHFCMPYSQSAQTWITQLYLQITPCPPLLRKRSPDGATPNWGRRHPIAAYCSFIDSEGMIGWVGLVGWPISDGLPTQVVNRQLQVERTESVLAHGKADLQLRRGQLPLRPHKILGSSCATVGSPSRNVFQARWRYEFFERILAF